MFSRIDEREQALRLTARDNPSKVVLKVADELETMTRILDTGEWNNHHRIVLLLTTQRGFSVTLIDTYLSPFLKF
ncbi:Uncharacterized protein HZ326_23560 [Fusarium oxysporum f. sp. albedinis]|nr:Uncharacterized protein HZ326_23560 [Fusarium oxysporum f. sp. albedinis]